MDFDAEVAEGTENGTRRSGRDRNACLRKHCSPLHKYIKDQKSRRVASICSGSLLSSWDAENKTV